MMNTDQLNAFLCVAQHRSFAAAAAELGISDRQISKKIIRLEARLGFKLINRDTRFRGLTRKGKVFLYHLEQLARALEAAEVLFRFEVSGEASVPSEIGPPLRVLEAQEVLFRFHREYPPEASDAGEAASPD